MVPSTPVCESHHPRPPFPLTMEDLFERVSEVSMENMAAIGTGNADKSWWMSHNALDIQTVAVDAYGVRADNLCGHVARIVLAAHAFLSGIGYSPSHAKPWLQGQYKDHEMKKLYNSALAREKLNHPWKKTETKREVRSDCRT